MRTLGTGRDKIEDRIVKGVETGRYTNGNRG